MTAGPIMQQQFVAQPQEMQNGLSPHQNAAPTQNNQASRTATPAMQNNANQQTGDVEMKDGSKQGLRDGQPVPVAPVIDPSLDMSAPTAQTGQAQGGNVEGSSQGGQGSTAKPVSLEITQAAMEAVLQSAHRESSRTSGTPDAGIASPVNGHANANGSNQQPVGSVMLQGGGGVVHNSSGGRDTAGPNPPHTTGKSPFAAPSSVQSQPVTRPEPMEPMLTENGEPMLNPAELLTQVSSISDSTQIGAILDMLLQESLASPSPS